MDTAGLATGRTIYPFAISGKLYKTFCRLLS